MTEIIIATMKETMVRDNNRRFFALVSRLFYYELIVYSALPAEY